MYCRCRSNNKETVSWDHINRLNPATILRLFHSRIWNSIRLCLGRFCVRWFQMICGFRLFDIGGIVEHHCLKKGLMIQKGVVWSCLSLGKKIYGKTKQNIKTRQTMIHKTQHSKTEIKTIGGEVRWSGWVISSCSISGVYYGILVKNPAICHEIRKGGNCDYDKWNICDSYF